MAVQELAADNSKSGKVYCDIRCPKKVYAPKYKKYVACSNLIVRVTPGSAGEAYCWQRDPITHERHGIFLFEIDPNYIPPPKKIIKVKKP